jgi:hypothetical protein
MTKIQIRGNCQCCLRDQAIVSGKMSKHGYTVEHGWFNGVCYGNRHLPLQLSRTETDRTAAQILEQAARLDEHVADLKAGRVFPTTFQTSNYDPKAKAFRTIPFAEADEYDQKREIKRVIAATENKARFGREFSADLTKTANQIHGTALREVVIEDGPAPIVSGEVRQSPVKQLTAKYADKGRVCYSYTKEDGRVFTTWMGVQAWRRLPLVATTA